MKKVKIAITLFAMAFIGITFTNCGDEETIESCAQDEICTGKNVTSCCTPTACVYKYNGKDYPESDIDELADDLGCTAGTGSRIAMGEERELLISRLQALLKEAKARL